MAVHGLAKAAEVGVEPTRVRRRMRPRAMRPTDAAHDSPAAALQAHLAKSWADDEASETKWSARRSLAFMLAFNGLFWAGLGVLIVRLASSAQ